MKALLLALALLVGVVVIVLLAHYSLFGFYLNLEIKPVDLGILAVNLFIALFLTQYLQDKAVNLRAEKDLLIADIRAVLGDLRSSREALVACYDSAKISEPNRKAILTSLRRVANGIAHIESSLGMSQCSKLSKHCEQITETYLDYKAAATGPGFPKKAYAQDQVSSQERAYRKVTAALNDLLFKINRHR